MVMPTLYRPNHLLVIALVFGLFGQHLLLGRSPGLAFPLLVGLLLFTLGRLACAEERVPTTRTS
ncbi:MAG: hypothetical protein AB4911_14335 [Oscillochloridaceae bacterium umkhey_bin13]